MSKISTIIDKLAAFLEATYPAPSQEHVNPYALELNDEFGLRDGWSFFLGAVQNTQEMAACQLSVERDIVINRSLQVPAAKEDITIRRGVEKALMEAQYQLLLLVENEPTIQDSIALITFVGDNGIELIQGDGEVAFLALRTTFTIRYYEQL